GLALLTHPVPALGDGAHPAQGIRVMDPNHGKPQVELTLHLRPGHFAAIVSTSQSLPPEACQSPSKAKKSAPVARHTVIPIVAKDHGFEPRPLLLHGLMHPTPELCLQIRKLGSHLL